MAQGQGTDRSQPQWKTVVGGPGIFRGIEGGGRWGEPPHLRQATELKNNKEPTQHEQTNKQNNPAHLKQKKKKNSGGRTPENLVVGVKPKGRGWEGETFDATRVAEQSLHKTFHRLPGAAQRGRRDKGNVTAAYTGGDKHLVTDLPQRTKVKISEPLRGSRLVACTVTGEGDGLLPTPIVGKARRGPDNTGLDQLGSAAWSPKRRRTTVAHPPRSIRWHSGAFGGQNQRGKLQLIKSRKDPEREASSISGRAGGIGRFVLGKGTKTSR